MHSNELLGSLEQVNTELLWSNLIRRLPEIYVKSAGEQKNDFPENVPYEIKHFIVLKRVGSIPIRVFKNYDYD